jgi:tetratricopeptide (TPR) repeat protein
VPAPAAARDWLDAERACLVAATAYMAADGGWPGHAIALPPILHRYLEAGAHLPDSRTVYAAVLRSARLMGDLATQAESLRNLGLADAWQSDYRQAAGRLRSALELYRRLGDGRGQVQALNNLGIVESRQSRLQQAAGQFGQALALARETGERLDEAGALTNLGLVEMRQGHYEQAACHQQESLAIFRELGNRRGEAVALDNLGEVLCRLGRYQEAEDHHGQALAMYREFGNRRGEAEALQNLGHVLAGRGRYRQAAGLYRQTLAIVRGIADRSIEAEALNSLGEALCAHHNDALSLACQTGVRYEQARAHDGLASAYHATGGHGQARRHWQQALTLYTDLGVPAAGRVSGKLSALARSGDPARKTRGREGDGGA